jgi:hypothetical protein
MPQNISIRERKRRMFFKMHNSFSNKMIGENIIWWNSLTLTAQYSILFKWISYKRTNKKVKLKYFLNLYKRNYKPNKINQRNAIINILTDE